MKCRICGFEVVPASVWGGSLNPPLKPRWAQILARRVPGHYEEHGIVWVPVLAPDPRKKED